MAQCIGAGKPTSATSEVVVWARHPRACGQSCRNTRVSIMPCFLCSTTRTRRSGVTLGDQYDVSGKHTQWLLFTHNCASPASLSMFKHQHLTFPTLDTSEQTHRDLHLVCPPGEPHAGLLILASPSSSFQLPDGKPAINVQRQTHFLTVLHTARYHWHKGRCVAEAHCVAASDLFVTTT